MKIGDLIKVKECDNITSFLDSPCKCFFCTTQSNRIGLIIGPAPRDSYNVMFDTGAWRLSNLDIANGDVEVINGTL